MRSDHPPAPAPPVPQGGRQHDAPRPPRRPVRPVFPGLTITAQGQIVRVVSMATLLQALDALRELE